MAEERRKPIKDQEFVPSCRVAEVRAGQAAAFEMAQDPADMTVVERRDLIRAGKEADQELGRQVRPNL